MLQMPLSDLRAEAEIIDLVIFNPLPVQSVSRLKNIELSQRRWRYKL